MTWVRPKWSIGNFSLPRDLRSRVKVISEGQDWGVEKIDRVHVCRSGCWVPPWLDKDFIEFVQSRGEKVVKLQIDDWDPMAERWTDEEFQLAWDQNAVLRAKIDGMRISQMSSGDFINGRVEQCLVI